MRATSFSLGKSSASGLSLVNWLGEASALYWGIDARTSAGDKLSYDAKVLYWEDWWELGIVAASPGAALGNSVLESSCKYDGYSSTYAGLTKRGKS